MSSWLYLGDCFEVMRQWPDATFDAVVSDPPYNLGYMGKAWDRSDFVFEPELWVEVKRMLKPGGHLLAFGGSRTWHRLMCAIEDADFEIRDSIQWWHGTGYPKSKNVQVDGKLVGTALKPCFEPIVMARKQLVGTVEENIRQFGTGGLNIDLCRTPEGRWPSNLAMDESVAADLDGQTQHLRVGGRLKGGEGRERSVTSPLSLGPREAWEPYGDSGGASRFYYVSKPGRAERDLGCEHLPMKSAGEVVERKEGSAGMKSPRAGAGRTSGAKNFHGTVKPLELMRHLCKLVTPAGGIVLDPFLGSGTTGIAALREGMKFVGIEKDPEYMKIAQARILAA